MRLIVTRPEEDAGPLRNKLETLGHQVTLLPLLRIVRREGVLVPQLQWQAVVATSANGVRAASQLVHLKTLRMLTVGPQSLAAARAAGFIRSEAHGGDVDGLARFIGKALDPAGGPILYLSGTETAGNLQRQLQDLGFTVERAVLYDAVPVTRIPAQAIADQDGVLLYSPRTARIWAGLAGNDVSLRHYCLSPNVAAALPAHWLKSVAKTPDESSMLALLDPRPRTV